MKDKTCCFTGHREIEKMNYFIQNRLRKEMEEIISKRVVLFYNGGALGFDTLAAMTVLKLRKKHSEIKLIMVLPCHEQDKKWSETDKQIYADILTKADKIIYTSEHYHRGCMAVRHIPWITL